MIGPESNIGGVSMWSQHETDLPGYPEVGPLVRHFL